MRRRGRSRKTWLGTFQIHCENTRYSPKNFGTGFRFRCGWRLSQRLRSRRNRWTTSTSPTLLSRGSLQQQGQIGLEPIHLDNRPYPSRSPRCERYWLHSMTQSAPRAVRRIDAQPLRQIAQVVAGYRVCEVINQQLLARLRATVTHCSRAIPQMW